MAKAIIYGRVSTLSQDRSGLSHEEQVRQCRAYCDMKGFEVAGVYLDGGVSGSVDFAARPQGALALAELRDGATHLVIAKLDRGFRNALDCLSVAKMLRESGATLHLLDMGGDTSGPIGKMLTTILAACAEWELDRKSERMSDAWNTVKSRGGRFGSHGYGFAQTGSAYEKTPIEAEQETIRRIALWRGEGESFRTIAARLNAENVPTRRGGRWASEQVRKIVGRSC